MKSAVVLLAFAATAAFAQAPHQPWRTITTKHFRVHYPAPFDAWATRAASRLESVRDAVVAEVGFAPEQVTDVIVGDPYGVANGETIPLLDTPRMVFWAHSPDPTLEIGEYNDWIDLLAVHETAHLVHLLRPSRNPFERFIERFIPIDPIVLRSPRWIFEGYATVIEGRLTGSGRPSGSIRAAILRKWALEGRLPSYGQLDSDRRFLGMSMAYLTGSAFLEWLEQRQGPEAMRHLWARLTARQRRSFDEAFAGVYGESPERLYGRFTAELTESAVALARAEGAREGELWQETSRNSGEPAVSPDGKSLAMVLRTEDDAKLVVFSTEENEEEAKLKERIDTMLKRDPQDVAPLRTKPLPRKPKYTLEPPDGGDVVAPRWTRDGRSIVYSHRQTDTDGVLHWDLFRWTPATGENARITTLADVQDADPLPDGKGAVAVRARYGYSQVVYVDLATGALTAMNDPSLDVVYSHPRARADGRIAWAEHRAGAWRVGDVEGAFAPEWGKDGALYAALARGGFIDIIKDGVPVTRTSGAAIDPAPSPDGSLYFMSLEPDGFVVRRLGEATPSPRAAASVERSFVPALPPPPAKPVTLTSETVTWRPYGLGRQEWSTHFGGVRTSFGSSYELGARLGDVVGRLDTIVVAATGGGSLPRGAALASVWRGWPVSVGAHLYALRGTHGAELRAAWDARYPLSHLHFEGGAVSGRAFFEGAFGLRQSRQLSEHFDLAADSQRHLRATVSGVFDMGDMQLAGAVTGGLHLAVGGVATSVEPESFFIGRALDPALDRDTLRGDRYRGERIELRSGALDAFWQRHRTDRTLDVFGLELALSSDPEPLVKAAGLDLTLGVARVRQERKTRAWFALRWRP